MTTFEALEKNQKIRASVHRDVQSMCYEACHSLGMDITKAAVELVLDIFMHKMTTYADDLERFAKHAKRTVINADDCRLLTRRNPALTAQINSLKLSSGSASKDPAKRRRTVAPSSAASSPAKRTKPAEETALDNDDIAIDLTFD